MEVQRKKFDEIEQERTVRRATDAYDAFCKRYNQERNKITRCVISDVCKSYSIVDLYNGDIKICSIQSNGHDAEVIRPPGFNPELNIKVPSDEEEMEMVLGRAKREWKKHNPEDIRKITGAGISPDDNDFIVTLFTSNEFGVGVKRLASVRVGGIQTQLIEAECGETIYSKIFKGFAVFISTIAVTALIIETAYAFKGICPGPILRLLGGH